MDRNCSNESIVDGATRRPSGFVFRQTQRTESQRSGSAAAGWNEPVDQRRSAAQGGGADLPRAECACTNLDEEGTRRQIRAALDAGATRDEIVLVLKCGVGLAVHPIGRPHPA